MDALKSQIMAFRLIQSNRPVPSTLQAEVCAPCDTTVPGVPEKLVGSVDTDTATLPQDHPTPNPYSLHPRPISASAHGQRSQRMLVPAAAPTGIDPVALAAARERVIAARVAYRINELDGIATALSNDPAVLPSRDDTDEASLKVRAFIELKGLRLLEAQKKLRAHVLKTVADGIAFS